MKHAITTLLFIGSIFFLYTSALVMIGQDCIIDWWRGPTAVICFAGFFFTTLNGFIRITEEK
jgi:hypothetical protein